MHDGSQRQVVQVESVVIVKNVALMFLCVAFLVCCCGGARLPPPPCDIPPYIVTYDTDPRFYPDELAALKDAIDAMEDAAGGSLRFIRGNNPAIIYERSRTWEDFPTNREKTHIGLWYNNRAYIAVDQIGEGAGAGERRSRLTAIFVHETLHFFNGDHYEGKGESCLHADMGHHFHCAEGGLSKADADTICSRVGCYCGR